MSTMGLQMLGEIGTASNAGQAKEFNSNNAYYIMRNAKGREVPVGASRLANVLKLGYQHTDGIVKSDDPSLQVQAVQTSPTQQLADVAKAMASITEALADPEAKEKRIRRSKEQIALDNLNK